MIELRNSARLRLRWRWFSLRMFYLDAILKQIQFHFWSRGKCCEDCDDCEVEGLKKDKAITALCVLCTGQCRGPASSQAGSSTVNFQSRLVRDSSTTTRSQSRASGRLSTMRNMTLWPNVKHFRRYTCASQGPQSEPFSIVFLVSGPFSWFSRFRDRLHYCTAE